MDFRETYKWLMRDRYLDSRIRRLLIRRTELMSCLEPAPLRYDRERVQESPKDKMASIMAEVDALDREIERLREEKAFAVIDAGRAIEQLEDENEKTILTMFFLERRRMEEIAEEIHYSQQHTYRVRNRGIQNLGERLTSR